MFSCGSTCQLRGSCRNATDISSNRDKLPRCVPAADERRSQDQPIFRKSSPHRAVPSHRPRVTQYQTAACSRPRVCVSYHAPSLFVTGRLGSDCARLVTTQSCCAFDIKGISCGAGSQIPTTSSLDLDNSPIQSYHVEDLQVSIVHMLGGRDKSLTIDLLRDTSQSSHPHKTQRSSSTSRPSRPKLHRSTSPTCLTVSRQTKSSTLAKTDGHPTASTNSSSKKTATSSSTERSTTTTRNQFGHPTPTTKRAAQTTLFSCKLMETSCCTTLMDNPFGTAAPMGMEHPPHMLWFKMMETCVCTTTKLKDVTGPQVQADRLLKESSDASLRITSICNHIN